ncbi:MAG: type II and III secretion system protein [Pleurocapsa sp.]
MTFADDFTKNQLAGERDYPSAFGITFTPLIIGVSLAVIGIVGAGYIFLNMVKPVQEKYQEVKTKQQEIQGQLDKIKSGDFELKLARLESEFAAQKVTKSRVLAMFTNEKDLDTLLIDINSFITANQGELIQYQPDSNPSTIQDSSLGSEVQGKLKRQGIALTIEGTFNQTKAIVKDLERLQPLLMINNIGFTVSQEPTAILTSLTSSNSELVPNSEAKLKTQIQLNAILPLSQKELEQAQQAAEEAEETENKSNK